MLTERLGFGTVRRMRQALTQAEFVQWWVYFARKRQRQELAQK
jgi:hypothetical protein